MVKTSKGKKGDESRQDGDLASELLASNDPAHGDDDNPPTATLADIQKLLTGMGGGGLLQA